MVSKPIAVKKRTWHKELAVEYAMWQAMIRKGTNVGGACDDVATWFFVSSV